jgi:hypothetical protein
VDSNGPPSHLLQQSSLQANVIQLQQKEHENVIRKQQEDHARAMQEVQALQEQLKQQLCMLGNSGAPNTVAPVLNAPLPAAASVIASSSCDPMSATTANADAAPPADPTLGSDGSNGSAAATNANGSIDGPQEANAMLDLAREEQRGRARSQTPLAAVDCNTLPGDHAAGPLNKRQRKIPLWLQE